MVYGMNSVISNDPGWSSRTLTYCDPFQFSQSDLISRTYGRAVVDKISTDTEHPSALLLLRRRTTTPYTRQHEILKKA